MPKNKQSINLEVNLLTKVENLDSSVKLILDAVKGYKFEPVDKIAIDSAFKNLNNHITQFSKKSKTTLGSGSEVKSYVKDVTSIAEEYEDLLVLLKKTGALNQKTFNNLVPKSSIKGLTLAESLIEKYVTKSKELEESLKRLNNLLSSKNSKKSGWEGLDAQTKKNYTRMSNLMSGTSKSGQPILKKNITAAAKELEDNGEISKAKELMKISNQYTALELTNIQKRKTAHDGYLKELEKEKTTQKQAIAEQKLSFEELKKSLSEIDFGKSIDFSKVKDIEDVKQIIKTLSDDALSELAKKFLISEEALKEFVNGGKEIPGAFSGLEQAGKNVDLLTSKLTRFFAVDNMIRLFKRAMNSAYQSIKELDAAMTELAVVTDFSISDLWDQLPEYTKQANNLGVATKEAYEAATLYYQQGLKTNEVNSLTTSTLKMARIASLDAATATDRMTNALRGFNMELNETNAERVADVYSELAAVSATDVDELSTAMTKTASIAASANMSFENTAAYLAQMLETTRESAETAGTALKTVIGRFTEVKELYTQGQLEGTDDEGEVIDVNKVSTALRTAGIDMNKFFLGEVGLDEIFNELAEKWNDLTIVLQRYIATLAAGSRLQSRFIAMMQDYDRLTELQADAYNAAGASDELYEKTLDSLETKLNLLSNAWNEFTMGIANSSLVKAGIDLLTDLLNAINNITTGFGAWDSGSIASSISKITLGLLGMSAALEAVKQSMLALSKSENGIDILNSFGINMQPEALKNGAESLVSPLDGIKNILSKTASGVKLLWSSTVKGAQLASASVESFGKTALVLLKPVGAVKGFNAGLVELIGTTGLVAIGIAAVVAATYALYEIWNKNYSFEALLNNVNESLERSEKAAELAKTAYDNLLSSEEEYNEFVSLVNSLVTGTLEWTKAIISANEATLALLNNYKSLYKYAHTDENGLITIDEAGWDEIESNYEKIIKNQTASQYITLAQKAQIEQNLLTKNTNTSRAAIKTSGTVGGGTLGLVGGAAGGTLAGVKIGAAIGGAGGPVGVIVGALAGAILGTIGGAIAGNLLADDLLDDDEQEKWAKSFNEIDGVDLKESDIDDFATGVVNGEIDNVTDWLQKNIKNYNSLSSEAQGQLEAKAQELKLNIENGILLMNNNITQAALEAASDEVLSSDYGSILASGVTSQEDYNERINTASKEYKHNTRDELGLMYMEKTGMSKQEVLDLFEIEDFGDMKRKEWRNELAKLDVAEDLGETVDKAFEKLNKDFGQDAEFVVKAMDEDNALLSRSLIEASKNFTEQLKKNIQEAYGLDSIDDVNTRLEEQRQKSVEMFEKAEQGLKDIGVEASKLSDIDISADAFSALSDNIIQVFETSGLEEAQKVTDAISSIMEGMQPEVAEQFAQQLGSIDWSDKSQVEEFSESVENLAKSANISEEELADLLQTIIETANAVLRIDFSTFIEAMTELSELAYSIQSGELDRLFSEDEKDLLIENDVADADDFVFDISTGNWDFIGDSTQAIVEAIQLQTLDLLNEDLDKSVKSGEAAASLLNTKNEDGTENSEYMNVDTSSATSLTNFLNAYIAKAGDASVISLDAVNLYAKNEDIDKLKELYDTVAEDYINLEDNKEEQEEAQKQSQITLAQLSTPTVNAGMIANKNISDDEVLNYSKALLALAVAAGVAEEQLIKYNSALETGDRDIIALLALLLAEITTAYLEAAAWGIETSSLEALATSLINDNEAFAQNNALAYDAALATLNLNEGLSKLVDNYEGWCGILWDSADGTRKVDKNSQEYVEALADLKVITKLLFNSTTDLDDSFFENEENMKLLEQAALGDVDAIDALRSSASEAILLQIETELDSEEASLAINDFKNMIASGLLEIPLLEAGAVLDDSEFITSLNEMIAASGMTAEQVQSYLGSLGLDAEISSKSLKVTSTMAVPSYSFKLSKSGLTAVPTIEEVPYTSNVNVPTVKAISGSYTSGGNINSSIKSAASENTKGGSSDSSDTSSWKNEFDWLYNLEQDITEEKRIQKILQEELNQLEEDENASGQQKLDNLNKQLENLEKQKALQKLLYDKRSQELAELLVLNAGYLQYAGYNSDDHTVEIDWNKINSDVASGALTEDLYNELEDYISRLEEIEGQMDDAQDELTDIDSQIEEINDYYHDDYVEFENRILDAIVELREREIDSIEDVSDAIDDANEKLIESINNALDKQRQERENAETEQDLTDLEQRIAYLSMDTSGANQLEIMDLLSQLDDARQDYTDSLIDLKISELEEQNDKASEERLAQIELMRALLEYEQENGVLWAQVQQMIDEGFSADGVLLDTSKIVDVISTAENWKSLSSTQAADMKDELLTLGSSSWTYLQDLKTFASGGEVSETLKNIAKQIGTNSSGAAGTVDSDEDTGGGQITAKAAYSTGASVTWNNGLGVASGQVNRTGSAKITKVDTSGTEAVYTISTSTGTATVKESSLKGSGVNVTTADLLTSAHKGKKYTLKKGTYSVWDSNKKVQSLSVSSDKTVEVESGYVNGKGVRSLYGTLVVQGRPKYYFQSGQLKNNNSSVMFESGGLADYTGPAWLDGTKSRPEYVLNADQTQAFLNLVDILDGFSNGSYSNTTNSQSYGDFNVNIQVDQLANDYDTDKLVKQIKKELYESSTYRNFNNVTRLR